MTDNDVEIALMLKNLGNKIENAVAVKGFVEQNNKRFRTNIENETLVFRHNNELVSARVLSFSTSHNITPNGVVEMKITLECTIENVAVLTTGDVYES